MREKPTFPESPAQLSRTVAPIADLVSDHAAEEPPISGAPNQSFSWRLSHFHVLRRT